MVEKKQGGSEVGVTCNYVDGQAAGWVPAAHIVPAVELKPSTQAEVWRHGVNCFERMHAVLKILRRFQ